MFGQDVRDFPVANGSQSGSLQDMGGYIVETIGNVFYANAQKGKLRGGVNVSPVTALRSWYTSCQKLDIWVQFIRRWYRFPALPYCLQHKGCFAGSNKWIIDRVIYHLRVTLWTRFHRFKDLVAPKLILKASSLWHSLKERPISFSHFRKSRSLTKGKLVSQQIKNDDPSIPVGARLCVGEGCVADNE